MDSSLDFKKPKVLFFDINETVLNMTPLKTEINNLFGQEIFDLWFTRLLHASLVVTMTGTFESFDQLAATTLKQVSTIKAVDLADDVFDRLIGTLASLSPYSDVADNLEILRRKGYKIAALSNSSKDLLEKQLKNARLDHLFDEQISVESFRKYKPHRQVYQEAAELLNTKAEECLLVAAHDWDVLGALCSGLRAVFVKRAGGGTYSFSAKPEMEFDNFFSLAKQL